MKVSLPFAGQPEVLNLIKTDSGNFLINSARVKPDKTFKFPELRALLHPNELVLYFPESLVCEDFDLDPKFTKPQSGLSANFPQDLTPEDLNESQDYDFKEDIFPDHPYLILIDVVPNRPNPQRMTVPLELLDLSPGQKKKLCYWAGLPPQVADKIPVVD